MENRFYLRTIGRVLLGLVCSFLPGALPAPCTTSSKVQLTVNSSLDASEAAEIVSCTGGTFSIKWLGNIVVPDVFNVSSGSTLSVYGGSTGSTEVDVMDGVLANQLFTVFDGELNLEGLAMTSALHDGSGAVVHANKSVVTMTDCVLAGNAAEYGGAVYLRESHLEIYGATNFTGNIAASGGAVFLYESHLEIYGVATFTSNIAENDGGAISATSNSTLLVVGEADWLYNMVDGHEDAAGGAVYFSSSSTLSILGKATLRGNSATVGGAVYWRYTSFFNVTGEVEFSENHASTGGAITGRSDSSESFLIMDLGGRVTFLNNTAGRGGAICVIFEGDLNIMGEVSFTQNNVVSEGGAIAVASAGTLAFDAGATVRFANNTCGGSGGGIAMWGSEGLSFSDKANVTFLGNTAGDGGGAIYVTEMGFVSFSGGPGNLSCVDNSATNSGGAIFVSGAERFYTADVKFESNTARIGGALVVESASGGSSSFEAGFRPQAGRITGCTFFDNVAGEDGGALHIGSGLIVLSDSTFNSNTAGRSGGAVSVSGHLRALGNCTFHMNIAPSGPALVNLGTVDLAPDYLKFSSNSLSCPDDQFIDYTDLRGDEASNVSEARYLVDCDGCAAWDVCTNCTVLGDNRVPTCAVVLDYTTSPIETGTLETLELESGYWRATNTSKTILSCFNEAACAGGDNVSSYCSEGYKGPYCAVCEEGYAPGLSFTCNSCSEGDNHIARIVVAAILVVVMLIGAVAVLVDLAAVQATPAKGNRCAAGLGRRLKASISFRSLKIAVVSWQIITQVSSVANATYPESYERFLAVVGLLNFDLASFLALACFVATDFYDRLLISTLGPIAVMAVLAYTYATATRRNRGNSSGSSTPGSERAVIRKKHASAAVLVAFFVYSSVSGAVFGMFACEDLDDGGSYLRGDYSIRCDTDKHRLFQWYAAVMILLYPVGIPVLFAALLLSNRDALRGASSSRDDDLVIKIFADLWEPYRPEMYLFELVEYLRRILLTGIVVFIFPNTAAQIAVTFVMEFFFFVASVLLLPYNKRSDTWLSHVSHVLVLVTFYLALLLKVDISDETDSSQEVFAGVLIVVHLLMLVSIVMETAIFMFQYVEKDGISTGTGIRWLSVSERQCPLPRRQSTTSSIFLEEQTLNGMSGEDGGVASDSLSAPPLDRSHARVAPSPLCT